ncbi:hypothetical protein AV530_017370 [Patagioenas fasciata monilis]|uniref:Rho-GAP domain-containing protein n=1 Tax=Patagioenas fasciata monilis TaxID=372326 RepID=A0A1V4JG55_PATFA|nr:hypothetical protein AV530_017370 [Patagioenas fasciata monilis]
MDGSKSIFIKQLNGKRQVYESKRDEPEPVQQCMPIPASSEPLLRQRVRVTQGRVTRKRDLLLFSDTLVIAKHQPPEGVEGAQVTQLPSFKALLKELRGRNAAMTLHAGSLERLLEGQAKDLLALLHEQGPSTEGIFRLAASERASRDIREALDTGAQVHLASQPVHVLAVILKDFLRKIPSKLLHSELYQQWMDALQKTSRQERLAGLKEVVSKLPKANLLLLQTLLSLLQKISNNVTVTKMTASNLAICVGPNLLSPPEEDTLPLDVLMQVTGKVTRLVEFLIEHREELFEEEEEEEAELPGAPAKAGVTGQVEESLARGSEGETAEVPAVTPECAPQESSPGQSSLPSSSQEGEAPSPRKRTHTCEEESDGPSLKRRRTLAMESSGMDN